MSIKIKSLLSVVLLGFLTISCDKSKQNEPVPLKAVPVSNARSANLIFEETMEGETPFSTAYDAKSDLATSYSLTYVTNPVFQGLRSARFELRDTDPQVSSGTRAEVTIVKGNITNDTWYSFAAYFPSSDFAFDSTQEIINQWYQNGSPATALRINKDRFYLLTGNSLKPDNRQIIDLAAVTKDEWHEFVFHFIHSYQANGLIEVWHNGVKILTHTGGNMYKDVLPKWKLGVYKSSFSNGTSGVHKRVLFYDNIRVGNSNATYAEMAPSTFPTPETCDAPSGLTATNVTYNAATINYNASTTGGTGTYILEYGVSGFTPGNGTVVNNIPNRYNLAGLAPNTAYEFYIRKDCGTTGNSGNAGPGNFTTTAAPTTCDAPTNLSASNITTASASLNFSPSASGFQGTYTLEYGPTGFSPGNGTVVSGLTTSPYNVTNLSPATTYQFYVTKNCEGSLNSTTSGPASFTTATPPPPQTVSFTFINADTDKDIPNMTFNEGATIPPINLKTIGTKKNNIRANVSPANTVGSVLFNLTGSQIKSSTDNVVPFAAFGDNGAGNYAPWVATSGQYSLKATLYTGAGATGTITKVATINFSVVNR
jgi:hypothetical protein